MKRAQLRWTWVGLAGLALGVGLGSGCSLAPKSFRDMLAPAPIVRARAVGLGEGQPEAVAVPALLGRLNDPDPVVRMSANDALVKRTGRDFGLKAWEAEPAERQPAVDRWRAWWADRARQMGVAQAGYPKDDQLRKVAIEPVRKRRKRRVDGGQGGPTTWPTAPESRPQPSTDPTLTP